MSHTWYGWCGRTFKRCWGSGCQGNTAGKFRQTWLRIMCQCSIVLCIYESEIVISIPKDGITLPAHCVFQVKFRVQYFMNTFRMKAFLVNNNEYVCYFELIALCWFYSTLREWISAFKRIIHLIDICNITNEIEWKLKQLSVFSKVMLF